MDISSLFAILVAFAGVATLQFFHGRKLNLLIMRNVAVKLEEVVNPADKLYTWLGGYIGFKAEYKVRDEIVEKIEATLTLLPRHSILYLPISKLTIGGDRLFLVARVRRLSGDVHAIRSGTYRFSKGIDREEEYLRERVSIDGEVFDIYYKRNDDKQKMLRYLSNLPVKKVKHVSITPETRVVYIYTTPDTIEDVIPVMFKMSRDFM